MKLFGMEMNSRMAIWFGLQGLIIVDILLITIAMLFTLPAGIALDIQIFDFIVCIILLGEWLINFYISTPKTLFLKQKDNILSLIASIPFDVILPVVIPGINLLRYLRLLKLLRIMVLFNRFFDVFEKFIKKSNLDKIVGGVFFIILIFTVLLYIYGSSYGLFDDFYFVIVTLTTVGYGDITPKTFNEKIISLILIVIGIFVFSTITAAISSFLTDRLLGEDDKEFINAISESLDDRFENVNNELKAVREENKILRDEISELKRLIEKINNWNVYF